MVKKLSSMELKSDIVGRIIGGGEKLSNRDLETKV